MTEKVESITKKKRESRISAPISDFNKDYLMKRLQNVYNEVTYDTSEDNKPFNVKKGCWIASWKYRKKPSSTDQPGYGQVKLSALRESDNIGITKQAKIGHVQYTVKRKLARAAEEDQNVPSGYNWSHLCGRGIEGCVLEEHGPIEPEGVNALRRDNKCWTPCECERCGERYFVNPCEGHLYRGVMYTPCIRGEFRPLTELSISDKKSLLSKMKAAITSIQQDILTLESSIQSNENFNEIQDLNKEQEVMDV